MTEQEESQTVPETPKFYYKVSQAAAILDVSVGTVRSYIHKGEIVAYRFSDRGDWRIPPKEFKEYVNERFGGA